MKRHLLSDVPVGLLLSGGVDSGLLLALMNLYGSSWRTYTVGYGSTFSDDELLDAEKTAARFSAMHTPVLLNKETFEEALPAIVAQLEEPIASSSIVPMYFVCQRAREDVKARDRMSSSPATGVISEFATANIGHPFQSGCAHRWRQ